MSAYSTRTITREQAEEMVSRVRALSVDNPVKCLSDDRLMDELDQYVCSQRYQDIVGCLVNYRLGDPLKKNCYARRALGPNGELGTNCDIEDCTYYCIYSGPM